MGSHNVDPYWVPGEHSIIETKNFKNPKDLANYLYDLCYDDYEYMKFFKWKKKGISKEFQQRFSDCAFYGAECRLCQYILEQKKKLSTPARQHYERRLKTEHVYQTFKLSGNSEWAQIQFDQQGPNALQLENQFTITAWINPSYNDQLSKIPILSYSNFYVLSLKKIWKRFYLELCFAKECYVGTQPILHHNWYHIGITFQFLNEQNDTVKFFVNGAEDSAIFQPKTKFNQENYLDDEAQFFFIGFEMAQKNTYYGDLDSISIWNYTFTPTQIKDNVYQQFIGIEKGLIVFYDFDHLDKSKIVDRSPNKLHLTIVGKPIFGDGFLRPLTTVNPCI